MKGRLTQLYPAEVHLLSRVKGSQIERVTALPLGPVEIIFYTSVVIFHSTVNNKFHTTFRDSNSHSVKSPVFTKRMNHLTSL